MSTEANTVPTSTTLKVVTVKLTLLFSPMFGTTCWTTGAEVMFSTIPTIVENILCIDYEKVLVRKTTQAYVDKFHRLIHIQVHRCTEMNQWCSHRQCWLGKGLADWLLPPNTRQHLCIGSRQMLRM